MLKIGDSVFQCDPNCRVYEDDAGNKSDRMNYRKSFRERKIVSETTQSWIDDQDHKIPKKPQEGEKPDTRRVKLDRRGDFSNMFYLTREAMEENIWVEKHAYKIHDLAQRCRDISKLKQLAEILGYEAK